MCRKTVDIPIDFFREHTEYDPLVDSCLRARKLWSNHRNFKVAIGDSVGTKQFMRKGTPHCWRVRIFKINYQIHRVIWELVNGKIPIGKIVDHINGNQFDNRIENLRLVDLAINARNAKRRKDNKTGCHGVRVTTNKQGRKYVVATYKLNKKPICKVWSLSKITIEQALKEAKEWRKTKLTELDNEFMPQHYE